MNNNCVKCKLCSQSRACKENEKYFAYQKL